MVMRYFCSLINDTVLVRVQPLPRYNDRLTADGWIEVPSLLGIVLDGDNDNWEELSRDQAEAMAERIAHVPGVLDA